jgi:hypothetical protein
MTPPVMVGPVRFSVADGAVPELAALAEALVWINCADFMLIEKVPIVRCCWKLLDGFDGSLGALVPKAQMMPAALEFTSKEPEFLQVVTFFSSNWAVN